MILYIFACVYACTYICVRICMYMHMHVYICSDIIQLLNDFEVYIEKYLAKICNINRAAIVLRNHSIIVLSHRLLRERRRGEGKQGDRGEKIRRFGF